MKTTLVSAETVSEEVFRKVVEKLLFPLFPGTEFQSTGPVPIPKKNKHKLVTQVGSGTDLKLMPHSKSKVCVQIHRPQKFADAEKEIIGTFLESIGRAYRDWETFHGLDTAASVMTEFVAGSIASDFAALTGRVISMLISWAQQTYEGDRIAFSVGFDPAASDSAIEFNDIQAEDFLKVLSNGHDTLLVLNPNGQLVGHETIVLPASTVDLMSPIRFEGVAKWTSDGAGRIAITLNRNGEILAFKQGALMFARRRGDWRYFAHDSVIACFVNGALARNSSAELRREIYRTALDAAFARSGACIGVTNAASKQKALDSLIDPNDQLRHDERGSKAKAMAVLIGNRRFQELDRRLRLELVSIDGATVLDHEGAILAVGAILKIGPGSSGGGGREAASRELARFGLGIKVSNDGYIRARNRAGDVIVEMA